MQSAREIESTRLLLRRDAGRDRVNAGHVHPLTEVKSEQPAGAGKEGGGRGAGNAERSSEMGNAIGAENGKASARFFFTTRDERGFPIETPRGQNPRRIR